MERFRALLKLQRHYASRKPKSKHCYTFKTCYDPDPTVQALLRADLATGEAVVEHRRQADSYAYRAARV